MTPSGGKEVTPSGGRGVAPSGGSEVTPCGLREVALSGGRGVWGGWLSRDGRQAYNFVSTGKTCLLRR